MSIGYRVAAVLAVALFAGLAGCAGQRAEVAGDGSTARSLFEEKCSFCHGLNVALEESHTLDGWRKLVKKEAGRKIWFINSTEREIITQYLFKVSPADREKPPPEPDKRIHDNPEIIEHD